MNSTSKRSLLSLVLVSAASLVAAGCVTVKHEVEPIDITIRVVDERLDRFFEDGPAATQPPATQASTDIASEGGTS